jgi:hypothetical protein
MSDSTKVTNGDGPAQAESRCALCLAAKLADMSYTKWSNLRTRETRRVDHAICLGCWGHRWEGLWFSKDAWSAWISDAITTRQFLALAEAV